MKYFLCLNLFLSISITCLAQNKGLDDYLQQAKQNSPLLKDLNNQQRALQLDSLRIRASLAPQVSVSSGGLFAPTINGYGYAAALTNGQTFYGLMGVTKTFTNKDLIKATYAGINLQRDSISNGVRLSKQELKRTIVTQYITAFGNLQQQKFNKEVVDLLRKEETLLKALTRSNVYRQSDYLTFLVILKQAELQLAQSRLQYKTELGQLNYLSGMPDTATIEIATPNLPFTVARKTKNPIFFRQFQLDSLRLLNTQAIIDYSYRPKLSVFADGGYNSDLSRQYYKNFGASAGFTISVPLYDGGQRKLQTKKLLIERETQQHYKTFFTQQYTQQVMQLRRQIADYDTLIADIEEQFKYSESLINVNAKLLQTGDLKMADLILAINNYLSIKYLLTQNMISRLQLINQLNYWSE